MIHSFIHSVSQSAQTVRDSTSSYKIDYVIMIKNFLNPEGHQNPFSGSKLTAILLKGWIWPIGGVASGGSAPAACAAGLFIVLNLLIYGDIKRIFAN